MRVSTLSKIAFIASQQHKYNKNMVDLESLVDYIKNYEPIVELLNNKQENRKHISTIMHGINWICTN